MKFSKDWLLELLGADLSSTTLIDQLDSLGLEVSSCASVAPKFSGVIVGEVVETVVHPNADRLTLCKVDVSQGALLNIVCGASNAKAKMKVAVAMVGAELPGGLKIKESKLRGVVSEGMLCSYEELGLFREGDGIIELPQDDAIIGMNVRDYLSLDDEVIEVEITANRGDCLSVLGIAREVAAANRFECPRINIPKFEVTLADSLEIIIEDSKLVPHYCGRCIHGINNEIETPLWMKSRLERSGVGSINLVVDVTNYVMLLCGQPMHAFDMAKIDQRLEVRKANSKDRLKLLDEKELILNEGDLIIADASRPLALAGVMGGIDSGISADTTDVFLESAFFDREQIVKQSQNHNSRSESSYRFERGVDYELQLKALDLATVLIVDIAGGKIEKSKEIVFQDSLPKARIIDLGRNSVKSILGIEIDDAELVEILEHLSMEVIQFDEGWKVKIPSFRFDLEIEEDLLEELARVKGYSAIPEIEIISGLYPNELSNYRGITSPIYALMDGRGYHEAITYSFVSRDLQQLFDSQYEPLNLVNPISSDFGVMRTSLFPGLLAALRYNLLRKQTRVRLFEIGLKFIPTMAVNSSLEQKLVLSGVACGPFLPTQWGVTETHSIDFFDVKNDVELILTKFLKSQELIYQACDHSFFHPKKSAGVMWRGLELAILGNLHPAVGQRMDLKKEIYLFEINLSLLFNKIEEKFKPFSKFPAIARDIAIIVNKEIAWQKIKDKIVDISGELLQNIFPFDLYIDQNLGLKVRSLAIRMVFQSVERTLTDIEIELLLSNIVSVLRNEFGVTLRERE